MRIAVLLVLVGALWLAMPSAVPEPSGEWARPYGQVIPDSGIISAESRGSIAAVRVLALDGGRLVPMPGARVSGWSEETGPGCLAARKLGEAVTDEFGIANVTWDEKEPYGPFHWLVEADGWGTWHEVFVEDAEVVLEPAATHRFRLLDPLGRPLAGARVECFHGCPHAPPLRVVTSDGKGLVVIEGLGADPSVELWVVAPGAQPGPYELPASGSGVLPTLLTDPGRTATGVVVGPDGKPRPGIVVREIGYPRGPVTTADENGRFELHGIDYGPVGLFLPGAEEERPPVAVDDFEEDVPLRIVFGPDQSRALGEGEVRHTLDVLVLNLWTEDSDPMRENRVPVSVARLVDGLVVRGTTGRLANGLFSAQVPPGEYRVVAGGGLSTVTRGEEIVHVPKPDRSPVRFVLDRRPSLHFRGAKLKERFVLRVPGASRSLSNAQFPPIPAEGPAALITYEQEEPVAVAIGPLADGMRIVMIPATLALPEPTRVRVRVRSEDPEVAPDEISLVWSEGWMEGGWSEGEWVPDPELTEDGLWIAEVRRAGRGVLEAEADGHQTERIVVELQVATTAIDLADVVLRRTERRTFRVVDVDGKPVTEVEPERVGWGNELLDDEGTFTVEVGPRPEPWIVRTPLHITPPPTEQWYPLPVSLGLSSDPVIRFPGGRITVEVRDEADRPLPAIGYVDLEPLGGQGRLDLRGIPAGAHVLLVGSPGRFGEVRRIVLRDGEHRQIKLVLRPR
jgi:hypothetical protein